MPFHSTTSHFLTALRRFGHKIKSLDGIDEVATIAAQILPGLAGPSAAFSILGIAIPFVYLGACGMKEEYEEACEEYDALLNSHTETKEKLLEIACCSERWRQIVAKKLQVEIPAANQFTTPKEASLEEVAALLKEHEESRNALLVTAYDKKYGHLGAIGMGGMLLGLFPSSAAAGIGIAQEVGTVSSGAVATLPALAIASGTTFGIGQAAMFGYAAARRARGLTEQQQLMAACKNVMGYADDIRKSTYEAVLEIIDKDIYFNRKHSIEYGQNTMIGQGFMMAGTALGLSGVAAPAGIACFAVGAPMTIAPAVSRIVYEGKEEAFQGNKETMYAQRECEKTDQTVITKDKLSELDQAFDTASNQLAYLKFLSLLHHASQTKGNQWARLEKIAANGNLSLFKGSGLQGDILKRVQRLVQNHETAIKTLFQKPSAEASTIIQANLLDRDNLTFTLYKPLYTLKRQDLIISLGIEDTCKNREGAALTTTLLSKLKSAHKAIRYDLAEKLVYTTECLTLQDELTKPKEQAYSYNPIHTQAQHGIYHHYTALRQSLNQSIERQQQQLEQYQQQAVPFTLARKYTNADGDMVYLWDHPSHPEERDHSITYIVKRDTGALTVLYGDKSSAIVAADTLPDKGIGVKLVDIEAGSHTVYGDSNNPHIHTAMHHNKHQEAENQAQCWTEKHASRRYQGSWYSRVASQSPNWGYARAS